LRAFLEPVKLFDRKFGNDVLASVPLEPGVYRYLDSSGKILYVGKAVRLRRRLQQYRNAQRLKKHRKMRDILKAAARLEFEACTSHQEACLLELRLIRELRPPFNVASAFSFLYPMIGVRMRAEGVLELFLTSRPETLSGESGISWHGAFRSRHWTKEFFEALQELLCFVAHEIPHTRRTVPRTPGVWIQQYRSVPAPLLREVEPFLRGEGDEFLSELVMALVENAGARARRAAVQEHLQECARFWRREPERLARARKFSGHAGYPVPQELRDELFLKQRLGAATADLGLG